MSQSTLEERVTALEKQVDELLKNGIPGPQKDWRSTIGMFSGDEVMKRIDAAGQAWRERERQRDVKGLSTASKEKMTIPKRPNKLIKEKIRGGYVTSKLRRAPDCS